MRRAALALLSGLAALGLAGLPAGAEPTTSAVLRVGVVDGSQPCSFREGGAWQGIAVNLWSEVAHLEAIPYVLRPMPSIREMLAATRDGRLDVAVECINLSPDRLRRDRFSLPFQEDGQAVMVISNPFSLGQAFFSALFSGTLLRLLAVTLVLNLLMTASVWWLEAPPEKRASTRRRQLQGVARVFAALSTGSGDELVVSSTRGRLVVMVAYLLRITASAVLVGFLTVELVQEAQGRAGRRVQRLSDLAGLRVGLKPGTMSEDLVKEINKKARVEPATIVPINRIDQFLPALASRRIDAVLADELQLKYLIQNNPSPHLIPVLAISSIRPELQGFALSPALPDGLVRRIDLAISELKRSGELQQLRDEALGESKPIRR